MCELLAPAGNIESLEAAIGEGADAVYLGLKSFNARLRTSNFAWNQFEAAVSAVHRLKKKIYVTVNTVCEECETERLYRFLAYLNRIHPDALIVQDFGIIRMCQEFFPNLELHSSTQMNVESAKGANLLAKQGIKRVVVARELGLEEIKHIKQNASCQIEMFVHGALCVSESGLCLFSSFLGGKSANRGMCTQACRRFYSADCPGGMTEGYYFSPCDMQLIDKIPELAELGVDSFKIEGRMKSAEYVGTVVSAYRYVLDHYKEDKKGAVATGKRILAGDFARTKTSYWYNFSDLKDGIENAGKEILNPNQAGGTGIYLGKIAAKKPCPKEVLVEIQKKLSDSQKNIKLQLACLSGGSYDPDPGDSIRIHTQNDTGRISHKIHFVEEEENGKRWIDIPNGFSAGDFVYLLQLKSNSRRYSKILPSDLSKFRRQPQDEILPVLDLTPVENKELAYFPEGIYVQVSSISDVFQAQILNPVRLILELNSETQKDLLNEKTVLPFSKKSVFISLDPFCPAAIEDSLFCTVKQLSEKGYRNFVANNLSHLEMLKGKDFNVVAGPYLYTFNRWAVSFLENQNITSFIMPYENSRKNLENTFEKNVRKRVLVPVFAYPALFRMRFKLPQDYNFTYFQDKEEVEFKAVSSQDGSFVMPEIPFSILDKIDILSQNGFKRYLIDFSKTKISRGELKSIQASMSKKQVLPEVSRFNWKNGFYNPEQIEAYKSLTNTTSKTNGKKPLKKSFRSKS